MLKQPLLRYSLMAGIVALLSGCWVGSDNTVYVDFEGFNCTTYSYTFTLTGATYNYTYSDSETLIPSGSPDGFEIDNFPAGQLVTANITMTCDFLPETVYINGLPTYPFSQPQTLTISPVLLSKPTSPNHQALQWSVSNGNSAPQNDTWDHYQFQ